MRVSVCTCLNDVGIKPSVSGAENILEVAMHGPKLKEKPHPLPYPKLRTRGNGKRHWGMQFREVFQTACFCRGDPHVRSKVEERLSLVR